MNQPWYASAPIIRHAGGIIDGEIYTNSKEAIEKSLSQGDCFIEVDFSLTSDEEIVLKHDWGPEVDIGIEPGTVPTLSEFKQAKIKGVFHTLSIYDLLDIMKKNRQMYCITDSKYGDYDTAVNMFTKIVNCTKDRQCEEVLDRFIVQIYNDRMLEAVLSCHPFKNIIYTMYQRGSDNIDQFVDFCKNNKIDVVTLPVEWWDEKPEIQKALKDSGLTVYIHTVDDEATADRLKSEGVTSVYSNGLSNNNPVSKKEKKKQKKAAKKEKKAEKKLAKKERKKRWKETKKEDRRKLKEHYKDAPWFIRIPRLLIAPLLKITFWIMVACAALFCIVLIGFGIFGLYFLDAADNLENPVSAEEIEEISPRDKEGAAKISSIEGIDPNETWTICVYMIGADLEDFDENDLSLTTKYETKKEKDARNEAALEKRFELLERYSTEIGKQNLPLPEFLYYPEKPTAYSAYVMDEVVVAPIDGAASGDIEEMFSAEMSDNIKIVVQTGGATRWSNSFINPNKTQRFLIKNNSFEEVSNIPLQRSTDPETLAEFIRFCDKNYKSDHNILVLWDHGAGPFGYGVDSVFGGEVMSIKEIRESLSMVYTPDEEEPPFDIIGFDACLMSNLEVTHALNGFASYYVLSEESEPGNGWDYTSWLEDMSQNPGMSPAAVAQSLADTYTDYYMTRNVNSQGIFNSLFGSLEVTFSVIDARKAEELYDAYCELTKKQLIDSVSDISVLAEIGRCCDKSTHVAADSYNVVNLVDLGNYIDYMVDIYPEECSKIDSLLKEAVLYHRENGSLCDAEGITVYIPGSIDSYYGLWYFLLYEYEICEDDFTRALYYYKMSGCLNDEMLEQIKPLTDKRPTVLDPSLFNRFEKIDPVISGDTFLIPVDENLQKMIQGYTFVLASYDDQTGEIIYYGEDEYMHPDGEGNLNCDFDGEWIYMDGQPLYTEITSATLSAIEYRSRVLYNGKEAYLIFSYDRDSEEFAIKGIREIPDENVDGINFLVNTKSNIELQRKDTIVPLYYALDGYGQTYDKEGTVIKYRATTKISMKGMDSGYWLGMCCISDQRGDSYSSKVIGYDISNGKIKDCKIDTDFIGADY